MLNYMWIAFADFNTAYWDIPCGANDVIVTALESCMMKRTQRWIILTAVRPQNLTQLQVTLQLFCKTVSVHSCVHFHDFVHFCFSTFKYVTWTSSSRPLRRRNCSWVAVPKAWNSTWHHVTREDTRKKLHLTSKCFLLVHDRIRSSYIECTGTCTWLYMPDDYRIRPSKLPPFL